MAVSWIRELRRRRVFRGVGVYIVLVWAVAMFVAPHTAWLDRGFLFWMAVLGAPFAGAFSWLFRVLPGEFDLEHGSRTHPPRTALGQVLDVGVLLGATIAVISTLAMAMTPASDGVEDADDPQSRIFLPTE